MFRHFHNTAFGHILNILVLSKLQSKKKSSVSKVRAVVKQSKVKKKIRNVTFLISDKEMPDITQRSV